MTALSWSNGHDIGNALFHPFLKSTNTNLRNIEFFILITDTDTDGHRYVLLVTDTLYCSLLHLCAKIKNILDLMNPYR
jgi:hypothetical protein